MVLLWLLAKIKYWTISSVTPIIIPFCHQSWPDAGKSRWSTAFWGARCRRNPRRQNIFICGTVCDQKWIWIWGEEGRLVMFWLAISVVIYFSHCSFDRICYSCTCRLDNLNISYHMFGICIIYTYTDVCGTYIRI